MAPFSSRTRKKAAQLEPSSKRKVLTKYQQQWACKPLDPGAVESWSAATKLAKFSHIVSHDSYLINLGSPDPVLRAKSIALFEEEVRRCEILGIPYLVSHPGAHMGDRP